MIKNFSFHCPTKDKNVNLYVDYLDATCNEDFARTYTKGRIKSCTANEDYQCSSCKLYNMLPQQITTG